VTFPSSISAGVFSAQLAGKRVVKARGLKDVLILPDIFSTLETRGKKIGPLNLLVIGWGMLYFPYKPKEN